MSKKRPAEFANVVIRFGKKVLIDYAKEIVIPAFLDPAFMRKYGSTQYFFLDQKLIEIKQDNTRLAVIVGRFIVNKTLKSEQEWNEEKGALLQKKRQMPTAPSAVFALILNTHRMVFLHETPHAPTLKNFEATLKKALEKHHKKYLDSLRKELYPGWGILDLKDQRRYEKELREKNPRPHVEVRPLTSIGAIQDYIDKFTSLHSITVELEQTNHDIDSSALLTSFRAESEILATDKAKMQFVNNQDGLDKNSAVKLASDATSQGNNTVTVKGKDSRGDEITGTNENLKAKAYIFASEDKENTEILGQRLVNKFREHSDMGILKPASHDPETDVKIINILDSRDT